MMDSHRQTYIEEARELLTELEESLLELEQRPDDREQIARVFRAMHTIKGSGAMFGFDDVARFTHEVETVFDRVRSGDIPVSRVLIDLTLKARDCIRAMIDDASDKWDEEAKSGLIASFAHLSLAPAKPEEASPQNTSSAHGLPEPAHYRIRFKPSPEMFLSGANPLLLLNELREMGDCTIVAQLEGIPSLADINSELCYTYWDIMLTTDKDAAAVRDVFIFVEDTSELAIEEIGGAGSSDDERGHKKLGEILLERGDIRDEDLNMVLAQKRPIGEMLVDAGLVSQDRVRSALLEQDHLKGVKKKLTRDEVLSSVRVPAEKLDRLVDLVGELVTVQARLTRKSALQKDAELMLIAEEVERLTEELRGDTMSIRMLPIGTTFGRFKRLVRDLSRELGKEVDLVTEGAETELDKTVIERLSDPLVHLIRNCIDHGIESPAQRLSRGKPEKGVIHLSAAHAGASVLITIRDDGSGLSAETIRAKAVEKGLIPVDALLTERELFSLIFIPGFSTASKITGVSGRGVGMDVVKRTIDGLRGSIEVESRPNVGTAITLRLPLTLAIIDGLLVNVKEDCFVIPLSAVEECIELTREEAVRTEARRLVNLRGQPVPYVRLRESFGLSGALPAIEQVVIVEADGHRLGFAVDQVVGQHQTVIKGLSRVYGDVDGLSGATIMGDGTVALILDVAKLAHAKRNEGIAGV